MAQEDHEHHDFSERDRQDSFEPLSDLGKDIDRPNLLKALRGKTVHIPNLDHLLRDWPKRTHEEVETLRKDINDWLKDTLEPGKARDAFLASDLGLFGAIWWPSASYERLKIVTIMAVWLFTWDDELDLSDGSMWDAFEEAETYRSDTLAYIRFSLGLSSIDPDVQHPVILNFAPVGAAISESYDTEHREMVYAEMARFMRGTETEQRLRLSGDISTVEEFWKFRLGSCAVGVCLAFNEYNWGEDMNLPMEFYDDEEVKRLYKCTSTLICGANDLLSVRKEIKRDAVDSLIPILYFRTGDIQTAVHSVVEFLEDEVNEFDAAVVSLFRKYENASTKMRADVEKFVEGCKYYVTGNLTWSLETRRYGIKNCIGKDGSIDIML